MLAPNHCWDAAKTAWTKWDNKVSGNSCGPDKRSYCDCASKAPLT
jgi:hypothetical protein